MRRMTTDYLRIIPKWTTAGSCILTALLTLSACSTEQEMTPQQRERIVRRLVQQHMDSVRVELDSICDARIAREIDATADSILEIRLEELRRLNAAGGR